MPDRNAIDSHQSTNEGSWIEMQNGKKWNLFHPDMDVVDISTIAHALSMQCRFNGHTRVFYSVAQHSELVSRLVPEEDALEGLLHDCDEALGLPDLPSPIKSNIPEYRTLGEGVQELVFKKFGAKFPMPKSVKDADARILLNERDRFFGEPSDVWGVELAGYTAFPRLSITPLGPADAKSAFLRRYVEITGDEHLQG